MFHLRLFFCLLGPLSLSCFIIEWLVNTDKIQKGRGGVGAMHEGIRLGVEVIKTLSLVIRESLIFERLRKRS